MKALLLGLLLFQAVDAPPPASPRFFRFSRQFSSQIAAGQTCAALDAAVYAHAAPSLRDLRLFQENRELPFAITLSEPSQPESEAATLLNLGSRGNHIVFDLGMPDRPYTDVVLSLAAHDFIAVAAVSGMQQSGGVGTDLGRFTLFDLTAQRLSRNTTLPLQEARFPFLHIDLDVAPAPAGAPAPPTPKMVQGASIPPSRQAQTIYTTVAETAAITQRGRQTVASFHLPAHVPVEHVAFALDPGFTGNFSRTVTIRAHAADTPPEYPETLTGTIERIRLTQAGHEIRQQQLTIPATLGANLQTDATVEVLVENGDDAPIPLASVALAMRERKVCFDAPATPPSPTLFYGDPALATPMYDFARVFSLAAPTATATLGPEQPNPLYAARATPIRPLTERHPELLWVVLLAVVCTLAVVALHSAKRMPK